MRKIIKPLLISLSALIVLLIIAISFALWFVFTPERITPVINKQAKNIFTCEFEIEKVELTFFSTFPNFSLKADNFNLINPVANAPSDTVVGVEQVIGAIDIVAFLKRNEIILSDIALINGKINGYVDTLGVANFDVFVTDTTETPDSEFTLSFVDIGKVELKNINLSFIDESLKINTGIKNLNAELKGTIIDDIIDTDIKLRGSDIFYIDETAKINTAIKDLDTEIIATIEKDNILSNIKINESIISLNHAGEQYLQSASVKLNFPLKVKPLEQHIELNKASFSLNNLELLLDGSVEIDTLNGDIRNDIKYDFNKWQVKEIMALIPPSFQKFFEGMEADGLLSSEGTIIGILNDSLMPLMDIKLLMENGTFSYKYLPLPVSGINANLNLITDLITDETTYLQINRFNARNKQSTFATRGRINNLFSDIHFDLSTNANLELDEFNGLIPDSLLIKMNGNVIGNINSVFHLSQAENMEFKKMRISGSLAANNLNIIQDSLWLKTDRSNIDFSLPNANSSTENTGFAHINFVSGIFETGKTDDYYAFMQNANISVETSDLRDTTKIPDIICLFDMDTISASLDTISVAFKKQSGRASIYPLPDKPDHPVIQLKYNSDGIEARAGKDAAIINKFDLDANVINDQSQDDIFRQWLVKGFMDINQASITTSALSHPIEIPAIKMDFDPEKLDIKDSRIIIDKSDFKLSGVLDNVLSYFRGDSLLRGNFDFVSANTDLLQLMAMTSGIGTEEDEATNNHENTGNPNNIENDEVKNNANNDTTFAGPYMVPEGVDLLLTTNIDRATFGNDTATDITGNVRVSDGILLLEDLTFTTSAARMQLTSMYRTPRKNHIYLGLDYHMLDIEIERLLQMIPDIDTLMPMLRSFRGTGEFHLAVECYTDSLYNVKKSTLRGASSIRGSDLVLLDGETFSEIANTLRFTKEAENRVDSLSAEFTIFREEIDIYPFLMVMDRYSVVVAGRHNFDLSFNYHITVVESPLPIRLGVDILGDLDNMSFRAARAQYPEFYRPASRRAVQSRQLEFRRMIRESITESVIEQ